MPVDAPVIAFGRGGATETIVPLDQGVPPTGVWFAEQTTESLVEAMLHFEKRQHDFDPRASPPGPAIQPARFEEEMFGYIHQVLGRQPLQRLRCVISTTDGHGSNTDKYY